MGVAHRSARYDYGGDRYVFVEFSIDMELAQNFKTLSMAEAIKQARIPGIVEVIPSICSMLVEYDRTKLHADSLIGRLKGIEQSMTQLTQIPTRIIDFPILFADPWTTECAETFKAHHNTGEVPNIDFVARENHFPDRESFINALCATPYWTVMVGFTPGLPWLYPLGVGNEEAIQAPKYNRPRTWTPDRAVGLGGAFLAIYSVRNPGGYQLLGRTTNPIYDAPDGLCLGGANLFVGNDKHEAGIEITMLGPQVRFRDAHTIALAGGDLSPKLNGNPVPMWETVGVKAGDLLSFGRMMNGCRAYLAVAGGIDVPLVRGSKATYARGEIGGYEGRVLRKGDVLKVGKPAVAPVDLEGRRVDPSRIPKFGAHADLRVVIGVESYVYTEHGIKTFLSTDWQVSSKIDRVGYRYLGPQLECVTRTPPFGAGSDPTNVVDSGYPVGSVHTTGPGVEPILLHSDAVS